MKRKIDEISGTQMTDEPTLYGPELKKRRTETQRIGDFIVDAEKSFNFRLTSDLNNLEDQTITSQFWSPTFMHWMFGEQSRINGYEGLSIDVTLSKKTLKPFIQISYEKKAPLFANIDNLDEKLDKHYGKYFKNAQDFIELLKSEENIKPAGKHLTDFTIKQDNYSLYKVSLDDESFHEQSFYMQQMLPFMIDGASPIEPCPFWQYFIIYEKDSANIVAYATVYEAHQTAVKFRAKISQVLVLPPYQKRGLGSLLYRAIYDHYRLNQENCFEIIVEDAAEDFQRIQDIVNAQIYFEQNKELQTLLKTSPLQGVIMNEEQVKKAQLTKNQTLQFMKDLKLPYAIILRLNELILFSFLDQTHKVVSTFGQLVKKRYYLNCLRDYMSVLRDYATHVIGSKQGLSETYIYNQNLEQDVFARKPEMSERDKLQEERITKEAVKIQLVNIYKELHEEYTQLKPRIVERIKIV